ncbi:MAG: uroporphyrinogen decarboxylase family protein [Caldilineaceae bacterium]
MRFHRDQYLDLMTFRCADRPMFVELFGPLIGLEDEWIAQGATPDELTLEAFDWDYVPIVRCGGNTGLRGGQKPVLLEETDEYRLERDALGRTMKMMKKAATLALPQDYPVTDMDSWLRVKPLYTFHEARIDWDAVEHAKRAQAEGSLVVATIPGGFDTPRELMGELNTCLAYYDQPELMQDILQTLSDTSFEVLQRISDHLVIDQLSVHEDMAGKAGPLVGPKQVKQFIAPYFRRIWDLLSSRGTQIFDMDSDGDLRPVLDVFMDAGLNSIHPLEPAAGMDIVSLRAQYGHRLVFRGGIDKHVLREDKAAILRELEYKLPPLMQDGGIAFGLDHRIPNGTPLENYRYYVTTAREILGLPPLSAATDGGAWRSKSQCVKRSACTSGVYW